MADPSASSAGDSSATDPEPGVLRVLHTKEQTRQYYNKIAKVYDLLSERAEQPMRQQALDWLDAQPGETVLEIGFGTGHSLVTLARAVGPEGRVLGIDISDKMTELARELVEKEGVADRVELVTGDAAKLPFPSESVDAVFMSFTLELFDTPEIPQVLAECRRVLRPGGRLSVVGVSREKSESLITKVYEWTHRHFPNLLDCRPIYIRRALEAAGFQIAKAKVDQMWVPVEIVLAIKPAEPHA